MWRPKSCTQTLPIANNIWGNGGQCRTLHIYRTMTSTTTPENKTLTLNIGKDYNFLENVIAIIEQLDLEVLNQVAEEQEKQEEQSFESMENQDTIKGKN